MYDMNETRTRAVEQDATLMMRKVYWWMSGALAITGLIAFYCAMNAWNLTWLFNPGVFIGLMVAELALVIGLSAAIHKLSPLVATLMFLLYAVINGVVLSSIFIVYDLGSIASTFLVTALTFTSMAIYGSVTKKDLTKLGSLCLMAVIGLVIALVVNLFLKSTMLEMIVSGIGVLVFVGLTAYDAQKIKALLYGAEYSDDSAKIAVYGALQLYLDFINLFLYLLRFLGRRR
ncbi:MAG: Bax inhibitor-1/YccA family protein [Bacteroidales bacterium]|nr:Bax inhibitor-1/YccA family protein [Bacteroidales bacterium]